MSVERPNTKSTGSQKKLLPDLSMLPFPTRRPNVGWKPSRSAEAAKIIEKEEHQMRVMVCVKATKDSEAGVMPSKQLLTEMGKFNEELVKSGVMLAGEGLHPTSKGKRVRFSGPNRSVIDGPFAETKELIAGFWLWEVRSMEEAVEWVKRCPNPMEGESEIEIRPVFEDHDFGAEFTPELREQEARIRDEADKLNKRGKS